MDLSSSSRHRKELEVSVFRGVLLHDEVRADDKKYNHSGYNNMRGLSWGVSRYNEFSIETKNFEDNASKYNNNNININFFKLPKKINIIQ